MAIDGPPPSQCSGGQRTCFDAISEDRLKRGSLLSLGELARRAAKLLQHASRQSRLGNHLPALRELGGLHQRSQRALLVSNLLTLRCEDSEAPVAHSTNTACVWRRVSSTRNHLSTLRGLGSEGDESPATLSKLGGVGGEASPTHSQRSHLDSSCQTCTFGGESGEALSTRPADMRRPRAYAMPAASGD